MDQWRITVLGDGGVGKTALVHVQFTFLNDDIEPYDRTIEDACRRQMVVDDRMSFVDVIDTAGQEEYATVREGEGFVLVYSITSRASFDRLEIFRQSMLRVKRSEPVCILVGNKCDQAYAREVSREEGAALARKYGCEFLETSAKTAQNVGRVFTNLVRTLRIHKESQSSAAGVSPTPEFPTKKKKSSRCTVL